MTRTYGTLSLSDDGRQWLIEAEPHVTIRLKRWFDAIKKSDLKIQRLTNTAEHARDLEMFISRFPLAMDPRSAKALRGQAAAHDERILTLERIIDPTYKPRRFELAVPARDYQSRAAEIYLARGGLLCADDLGTGKTCTAICSFTEPKTLPAVVVCPPHLQIQWKQEINRFIPALYVHIIKTTKVYELPRIDAMGPDVVIISYTKLAAWGAALMSYVKSIVFEEAHELRRHESYKYQAAAELARSTHYRIGLTATPIQNYGGEIYNVVDCISPGVLGSWEEFAREWCDEGSTDRTKAIVKDPQALGSYLREHFIMIRRTRHDVGRELPPLQKITHTVESDTQVLTQAKDRASELARIILSKAKMDKGQMMHAHEEFNTLMRQITGLAKAPYVAEFVRLLVESGEKVLLFGWHRAVYDIWAERLKDFRVGWYTGSESVTAKQSARERMLCGELDVLMLSLRSGSGLDGLQRRCRTVVFGELDWSPGVHEQCTGRLYRDGQVDPVTAYYLIADDGADPIMARVLGLKREQVDGLRNQNRDHLEQLQRSDDHLIMLAERVLGQKRE